MAVKFGKQQLNNPTPTNVGRIMKIIIAVNSATTVWMGTADFIPSYTAKVLGSILSLVSLLCVALEPFFGIPTTQKRVDIEDVSAMSESKKDA